MIADQHKNRGAGMLVGFRKVLRPWLVPAAAFGIAFAGVLAIALLQSAKPFYYDSLNYWMLGKTFTVHGNFSLLNFNSPLRGYLLPLIDHGLHGVAVAVKWTDSTSTKLFNVLIFSLIGAVLAPRFAEITWPEQRWSIGRRLAIVALLVIFWSGYLDFPLSDFPALAMTLLALVAIDRFDTPGWMLIAGFACGAAIDMRPSYELLAPILGVLVACGWFEGRGEPHASIARRSLCIALLVVGLLVVSLPQSLSSHRHFHSWSFVPGTAGRVAEINLTAGLALQRYETYVGVGHGPQMNYEDEAGSQLLAKLPNHSVSSTGQYLELIVSHPTTMVTLFVRHVINGLDQRYTTPYVEHLDTGSHRWLRLAGLLLIFLGLLRVLWSTARRCLRPARWRYPIALALCCVTTIPSAMETRYLLPVYLLGYILVLSPAWPNPIGPVAEGLRRYRTAAIIVAAYLVSMAVVWQIAGDATRHLHFG
jgi:hypothetical protein